MFADTLHLIPNGVLLIDLKAKKITFANKEMEEILGETNLSGVSEERRLEILKSKVTQFFHYDHAQPTSVSTPTEESYS